MNRMSKLFRASPVDRAAAFAAEYLEGRTLLAASVVLGSPINLSASGAGITPQFDWLAPLVNGNPDADLVVSNSSGSISVLRGNGDGSFQNPTTYPVQGTPLPLTTGQLITGSNNQDIVVGTTGSPGSINILIGNGDGTFQQAISHTALGSNRAIGIGAFVDGGPADIVSIDNTSGTTNNVGISYTDGNGNIISFQTLSAGHGALGALAVGNFGNGHQDIAVLSQTDSSVTVFLGNGNGTFQAPTDYKTGASPTSIAVGDFNGDGKSDLVTANSTAGTVSFLAGKGDGTFAAKVDSPVAGSAAGGGPLKVRVGNFTGTTKADLLCLLSPGSSGDATILLGQGNGTFQSIQPVNTGGGTRTGLAVGDLNGDGLPDVVLSNSSTVSSLLNTTNTDTSTPTATVNPGSAGSSQSSVYQFSVTYTDSKQVDAQTIGNTNLVVTAPSGVVFPGETQMVNATVVSQNLVSGPTLQVTYQITFPSNLTSADNGTYTVSMNSNSVKNAGGIAVAAGTIGTFTLNVSTTVVPPPTAAVSATQSVANTSENFYQFNVTFNDQTAINVSSLGNNNLVVTAPTGVTFAGGNSSEAATLVTPVTTNAATVNAVYQVAFPANLSSADAGTYQVSINANTVTDTGGLPVAGGNIGSFSLSFTPTPPVIVPPTGDFTPGNLKGKFLPAVVAGSKLAGVSVTVVNTSGHTITGSVTVGLNASNSQYVATGATSSVLTSIVHGVKNLKSGKGFVVHFKPTAYPTTAGLYYLVANAQLNGTADSYDAATSQINVAAAFVDARANGVTPGKATLTAGKNNVALLNVTNIGNVTLTGASTVEVFELVGGTQTQIATANVNTHLTAGQTKTLHVTYKPATIPTAGSGNLVLTILAPGDTNAANNSATSAATVTF